MFKPRTKLGKWLDKKGLTQKWLSEESKTAMNTITKVCNDDWYRPNSSTKWRIINALRKVDPEVYEDDFWA